MKYPLPQKLFLVIKKISIKCGYCVCLRTSDINEAHTYFNKMNNIIANKFELIEDD